MTRRPPLLSLATLALGIAAASPAHAKNPQQALDQANDAMKASLERTLAAAQASDSNGVAHYVQSIETIQATWQGWMTNECNLEGAPGADTAASKSATLRCKARLTRERTETLDQLYAEVHPNFQPAPAPAAR